MASSSSQENPPIREKNLETRAEPKPSGDIYRRKYALLKRRCEGIQLDNEKCLNRIYYVKKAVRQMSRERRFLMSKLNKYGDDYKNTTLPLPIEDDSMLHLMSINTPINTPSFPASRGLAGLVSKSQQQQQQQQQGKVSARRGRVGRPRLISEMTSRDEEPAPTGRGNKRKRMMSQNPLAPKKPANAFLMFCQTKRQTFQEESANKDPDSGGSEVPAMTHQEMTRQLAKKWNFLGAGEKEAYYNMYERDKDRYHKEMKEYIKSNNLEPNPLADPTPQPTTDVPAPAVKKDPVPADKQNVPRKEPPGKQVKSEPEADRHSPLLASGPSVSTAPAVTTSAKSAVKLESTLPVKAEPKATSLAADGGTHKLKNLQLKMTDDVDDPYHFDDD